MNTTAPPAANLDQIALDAASNIIDILSAADLPAGISQMKARIQNAVREAMSAAPVNQPGDVRASLPTEISERLRERARGGYTAVSPDDGALMLKAADECERFYGGMMAWKKTAEAKDAALATTQPSAALTALQEICDMQERNYGDGINTHLALISLCEDARAILAESGGAHAVSEDKYTGKFAYTEEGGESFTGIFDSEADARAEADAELEPGTSYTVAECVHPMEKIRKYARRIGSAIVERLDEWAFDEVGGDDPAIELNDEDAEKLGNLALDFAKREGSVNRWGVKNERHYVAPVTPTQDQGEGK